MKYMLKLRLALSPWALSSLTLLVGIRICTVTGRSFLLSSSTLAAFRSLIRRIFGSFTLSIPHSLSLSSSFIHSPSFFHLSSILYSLPLSLFQSVDRYCLSTLFTLFSFFLFVAQLSVDFPTLQSLLISFSSITLICLGFRISNYYPVIRLFLIIILPTSFYISYSLCTFSASFTYPFLSLALYIYTDSYLGYYIRNSLAPEAHAIRDSLW